MRSSIRVEGVDSVAKQMRKLGAAGEREIRKAVRASLEKVRGDAIKSIQRGDKTGAVYERGPNRNLSPTHQASAPGQAPATDTGTLVSSIRLHNVQRLSGEVGTLLDYGFWLEYGTVNMEPRPWLNPALEGNQQWIEQRFAEGMAVAEREASK